MVLTLWHCLRQGRVPSGQTGDPHLGLLCAHAAGFHGCGRAAVGMVRTGHSLSLLKFGQCRGKICVTAWEPASEAGQQRVCAQVMACGRPMGYVQILQWPSSARSAPQSSGLKLSRIDTNCNEPCIPWVSPWVALEVWRSMWSQWRCQSDPCMRWSVLLLGCEIPMDSCK